MPHNIMGIRLGHNVVIWPYYALHVGHRLKILWGKSQATVPAPGKKGGRELAPVPGLPEGKTRLCRYMIKVSYRIFPGREKCRCVQWAHALIGALTI